MDLDNGLSLQEVVSPPGRSNGSTQPHEVTQPAKGAQPHEVTQPREAT